MKLRGLLVVAMLAGLLVMSAAACEEKDGGEPMSTPTPQVAATATLPAQAMPAPTDTPPPSATDTPVPVTYEIAEREDVSFGAVVRIVYRVRVSGPLTEQDLRRISQQIIDDETDQHDVNAIGFFFYLPGTDTTRIYTAGTADWAPDGDWARADTVQAGNYSRHRLGAIDLGGP